MFPSLENDIFRNFLQRKINYFAGFIICKFPENSLISVNFHLWNFKLNVNKNLWPFLWKGFHCLETTKPLWGDTILLLAKSPEALVLIWLTSEGWKAASIMQPPSLSEPRLLDWESSVLKTRALAHFESFFLKRIPKLSKTMR